MSFLDELDQTTVDGLTEIIGNGILPTVSVINTKYVDKDDEFSGTGLLISDGAKKYVFTACHVLDPSQRIPETSGEVELNYHSFHLEKGGAPNKLYALRRKYFRSCNHDLAIVESAISELLDVDPKIDYYPIDKLTQPLTFDPYLDDLFVVCGFPDVKRFPIPVVAEVKHEMLVHYFSGRHGRQDPDVSTRFRIKFNSGQVSPAGISGSPVWLIRNRANINAPLSIDRSLRLSGKEFQLDARVVGIVIKYFEESQEISVVKSEVCAEFVKQAQAILPSLRSPEEDEWIELQLQRFRAKTSKP